MDFFFDCPSCNGSLVVDDSCRGQSTACPHCLKWIPILPPGKSSDAPLSRDEGAPVRTVIDAIMVRELEELHASHRKLQAEYDELELQAQKGRLVQSAALEKQLKSLLQERDELAAEVGKVEEALATLQVELEACRTKLHKSRNEQQVLIAANDRLERENKATQDQLSGELLQARQDFLTQQREVESLKAQLADALKPKG